MFLITSTIQLLSVLGRRVRQSPTTLQWFSQHSASDVFGKLIQKIKRGWGYSKLSAGYMYCYTLDLFGDLCNRSFGSG